MSVLRNISGAVLAAHLFAVGCQGGVAAPECQNGLVSCAGQCLDARHDPANCGACGNACDKGAVCSLGKCASVCAAGTVNCNGSCTDTQADPFNCHECGKVCASGFVCSKGACSVACADGLTNCGGGCYDVTKSAENCGGCGKGCKVGEVCVASACSITCLGGATKCGNQCVVTASDPQHCGGCGAVCGAKQACVNGACTGIVCVAGSKELCYEGPSASLGVGACKPGTKTCLADGTGYDKCLGQVVPEKQEICNDALDNDCNGFADDGCPMDSCKSILALNPKAKSGVYTLAIGNDNSFKAFCDMTTQNGGWTFVMGIVPTDGNLVDWFNTVFWLDKAENGDFNKRFSTDYKSPASWQLEGTSVMIQVAAGPNVGDVVGYRGWAMTKQAFHAFFSTTNKIATSGTIFQDANTVFAWEPLVKVGNELIANRIDNPNGDATRLGVTNRPFSGDDNQPGLGTAMNYSNYGTAYRHADVELQWNTNSNIWCNSPNGDGTHKWLGSDAACGANCGSCQTTAGPGYAPAWNYRIYVR